MKRINHIIIFIFCLLVLNLKAQGTTFLSSLGATPIGSRSIGSDSWWVQDFKTVTNSLGYDLNSIDILVNSVSGSPNGISLSLEVSFLHTPLGNLAGPEPTNASQ
jgi:hypothetical protein